MEKNQNQGTAKCPYSKFSNFLKKYTKRIPHFSDDTKIRKRETMELLNKATGPTRVSLEKGIFYHHYQKCFDGYYTFFCNNHKELLEDVSSKKYTYDDFNITDLEKYEDKIVVKIKNLFLTEGEKRHSHTISKNGNSQIKEHLEEFSTLKMISEREKLKTSEDKIYKGYANGITTMIKSIIFILKNIVEYKSPKNTINYNQLKKICIQNSLEPCMNLVVDDYILSQRELKTSIFKPEGGYINYILDYFINQYDDYIENSSNKDRKQGADIYGCPMKADFHTVIPLIVHLIHIQLEKLTSSSTT